jgi:DNA-binding NtrC family response regulator
MPSETRNRNRIVLVVDDETDVRRSLKRLLEPAGYTVHAAKSGVEGLEVMKDHPVQLVISDKEMPGMSGIEFLKLVRDRHPHVRRIMLTGRSDLATALSAINEGEVYRFLPKPWSDEELLVALYFAFEAIELEDANRRLVAAVRRQAEFLTALEKQSPGISAVVRDAQGAVLITEDELRELGALRAPAARV